MSSTLMWEPENKINGSLPDELKYILRKNMWKVLMILYTPILAN
jgi:hypothetical protein